MTNEQRQMLLDLSRKLISDSMTKFNDELSKIQLDLSNEENEEIFASCKQVLGDIESELNKARKLVN